MIRRISSFFSATNNKQKKDIKKFVKRTAGVKPENINLYVLALTHVSYFKRKKRKPYDSNERLEYLGDAMLGAVIAEYLFKKYPLKDEGFLTDIRSRIVNRESLNRVGRKIGLDEVMLYDRKVPLIQKSMYGDSLEALIGAIYLDKGYKVTKKFVIQKILEPHFNINDVVKSNPNQKSIIIEWAQKESKEIRFETIEVKDNKHRKEFVVQVYIDDVASGKGYGTTKKKAEQDAAQRSCELLEII